MGKSLDLKEGQLLVLENDYKTEEKHPDYKGQVVIEGRVYKVALWAGITKSDKKKLSGRITLFVPQTEIPPTKGDIVPPAPDDGMPF